MDPLAAPQDLPVFSMEPDAPEVVIDMAVYAERFNDEPTLSTDTATTSRQAPPPVNVGSHRLSTPRAETTVAAADRNNRVVLPTAGNDDNARTPRQVYDAALEQFNNADYQGALISLSQYVEMGASPDYLDNAYFWIGESHYGLGQYNRALASFQRVVSDFPNGNKVPDSLLKIALTHERMSQQGEARETLRMLVDTYPTTNAAERAAERLRALQ
jgi:tol-pal system protein YbgF